MTLLTGIFVGITSLIPGISGGTIIFLLNQYEKITNAIIKFQKKTLLIFILGIILGAISFAKILSILFKYLPNETLIFFASLILLGIPNLIKKEKIKLKPLYLIIGSLIILILSLLSPNTKELTLPILSLKFLILFFFFGSLDGFFTILPGISGSMIMIILGPYFWYQNFLANLTPSTLYYLIPLTFYFLGDALGFFIGSKASVYFLTHKRHIFFNIAIGLVFTSALKIWPITSPIKCYILPLIIILLMNKLSKMDIF